jgi:tyrosine ammonia-lyase
MSVVGYGFEGDLSLAEALAIVSGDLRVSPSPQAWARVDAAHGRLRGIIDEARHVYGVTTGFGPLANRLIDPEDGVTLQQNLVHHLATGQGAPLGWAEARAVCLARLSAIMRGYSGASRDVITRLVALLNSDLAPLVPERGTVGASGDLTPLAHVVLALQGRGGFVARSGATLSEDEALARLGLSPLDLGNRDGLALVNGTSAMTGIALVSSGLAHRLVGWAIAGSAGLLEVMGGRAEAWSPLLSQVRAHPGQVAVTKRLNARLEGSAAVVQTPIAARRLAPGAFHPEEIIGQDAYSLRCVPQVLGAVMDALTWHDQVLSVELNAVSDNPVLPVEGPAALHGGNFMGQHIAMVSDSLNIALVVMAGLVERQVARVTDERLNAGLPAFLHRGPAGLNSGFMGAQVTASATLAEMRSLGPASVHSISTNGANQDVVSMGTIAARNAARQVQMLSEILAIQLICVAQAIEIRGAGMSPHAEALRAQVRDVSPALETDRPLASEIAALAARIRASDPEMGA